MEELDLKELLMLFWNRKVKIILIIAIFIALGIIYTIGFVTPEYTSSTSLLLANSSETSKTNTITTADITLNSKLVSTYSELIKSKKILTPVIENLGIDENYEKLKNSISVSSVKDTELIKISVTNESAVAATKIANEIAKVFKEKVAEDIYKINNVVVIDEAVAETTVSNVNHAKDVVIFMLIGIVVSIAYVLIANMLDTTIKTEEEVEKLFKVPVLASIPMYEFDTNEKGGKRR